jgi:hypothetical protein
MLASFLNWLTNSPWSRALAASEWAFPIVQSLHFMAFALLIGTIAIVDLRLLGFGMRQETPAGIARDLRAWTWAGLAIILTTGPIMFSGSATAYPRNAAFRFKMIAFALALLFHFTFRRRAIRSEVPGIAAKLAGAGSLALWSAVVAAGRMIAFV